MVNAPSQPILRPSSRNTLRVLVADDEPLARERLRQFIEAEEDLQMTGECSDGAETLDAIRETSPQLVFLDVRMPKLDGFSVLAALEPHQVPSIIFVTGHDQYALRAFETRALDYLLKPFDRSRFQQAVERARQAIQKQPQFEQISELLDRLKSAPNSPPTIHNRIAVKSRERTVFVNFHEIDWVGGADNYVELHVGKSTYLLRDTITGLAERLPSSQFLRISRSLIVNVDRIKEAHAKGSGRYKIILRDGTEFPVGRKYRHNLDSLLGKDD